MLAYEHRTALLCSALGCRLEGEGKAQRTEGELEKTAADATSKAEMKAEGTKVAHHMLCCVMVLCRADVKGASHMGMPFCDM